MHKSWIYVRELKKRKEKGKRAGEGFIYPTESR